MTNRNICILSLPKHTSFFPFQFVPQTSKQLVSQEFVINKIKLLSRTCSSTDCSSVAFAQVLLLLHKENRQTKKKQHCHPNWIDIFPIPAHAWTSSLWKKKVIPPHGEEKNRVNILQSQLANNLCFLVFHQYLNSVCFKPAKSKHLHLYIPVRQFFHHATRLTHTLWPWCTIPERDCSEKLLPKIDAPASSHHCQPSGSHLLVSFSCSIHYLT